MKMERLLKFTHHKNGLFFVLLVSAVLKIILMLFMRPFNSDGVLYITAAQYFAAGNFAEGIALYPMPFYSMMLCMAHFLVPHWEISAKLVSMASIIFATIPLYLLTADLFHRRAAFWACLAFAVMPLANDWAVDVLRGPVFVFFLLWAVYFMEHALISKQLVHFFLGAMFSCLAVLLRIEGIILILFILFFCISLIFFEKQSRIALVKGISAWILVVVVFSGVCVAAGNLFGDDFNRFNEVAKKIQAVGAGNFLDTYHQIYDQMTAMEALSPFSHGRQNFAEIARHFMPLIYLVGLMQVLIIVLFPFFLIPLFWGFRHSFTKNQVFVLALVGFYLLVLYVSMIERDFIQRRFLFAPAVLLYPWIGVGLEKIITKISHGRCTQSGSRAGCRVWVALFLVFFMAVPVFKTLRSVTKNDNVLRHAGTWLAANPEIWQNGKILVNDVMAPFFAGMHVEEYLVFDRREKYNFSLMGKWALKNNVDTLVIKLPNDRRSLLNALSGYKPIKQISGKKRSVHIYGKL